MKKSILISEADLFEILSALDTTVVSLDRIGSSVPFELQPQQLNEFMVNYKIYHKLANARRLLFEACDKQFSRKQNEILEQRINDIPCWKSELK
jgi:hypothetical protein